MCILAWHRFQSKLACTEEPLARVLAAVAAECLVGLVAVAVAAYLLSCRHLQLFVRTCKQEGEGACHAAEHIRVRRCDLLKSCAYVPSPARPCRRRRCSSGWLSARPAETELILEYVVPGPS